MKINSNIHPTFIQQNFDALKNFLKQNSYSKIFILTDSNTRKYCLPIVSSNITNFETIEIKTGEENKTMVSSEKIWKILNKKNADRNSLLINLGGGMISDLGGFAASVYKRGIDFIHIPTSLMAMCDAAIGGKTGINFESLKNNVGTFQTPKAVFINPTFLETLPKRELLSGFAEIIKHSMLINDVKTLKEFSEKNVANFDWLPIITSSVKFKIQLVEKDFNEKNIRKQLNFGHTIGHAVETLMMKKKSKKLLHGEAIAVGIWMETLMSIAFADFPIMKANQIFELLEKWYGYFSLSNNEKEKLIPLMLADKKNQSSKINFTLLKDFGKPIIDTHLDEILIKKIIHAY